MSENRKIAKNSLILYVNLVINSIIGLFTVRIILLELGAENYGLYAVVGGIVTMMGFLSSAMLATSYRFIAVEIGKGDEGDPNKVFNTTLVIHLILALILFVLGETVGIWYIRNYLNVSINRIPDAIFVLHFTVLASMASVIVVPFSGLISAREKFVIRASIEIIAALLKLGFVLLLILYIGDKLKAYALIMAIIAIIPLILLSLYCHYKEHEVVVWKLNRKISDYKEMFSFTGWIMIGTMAYMGVRQGAAVMINFFFGTIINAAFGIASQINNYIMLFVTNLTQAAVPQIMKNQSSGNSKRSLELVYIISKFAFFVMLIPAVPIILSINSILILWLKEVPESTKQFAILMIINGLIGCTASGFDAAIQATGKIRKNQICYSLTMLLTLPIAYFLFKLSYPAYIITIVTIGSTATVILVQAKILAGLTDFRVSHYFNKTIKPVFLVTLLVIPQILFRKLFGQSIIDVILFSIISVILIIFSVYIAGITKQEKSIVSNYLHNIILIYR